MKKKILEQIYTYLPNSKLYLIVRLIYEFNHVMEKLGNNSNSK